MTQKMMRHHYSLPTEAEWEYAAKAGTIMKYSWGSDEGQVKNYAWYWNRGSGIHTVGGKKPNPWGLYDMHGNVWEWVQDWYGGSYYSNSPANDPKGHLSGRARVFRGGGWYYGARVLRSARRFYYSPGCRINGLGFRLLRTP